MNTSTHESNLRTATKPAVGKDNVFLTVADGEIAKNNDTVTDLYSGIEGVLRYTWIAWLVNWSDGIETVVADPSLLKLKSKC